MRFKAVLFDLDGTLLDTLDDLADAANRVLATVDLPTHPRESYRYFVGDGLRTLIQRILPEERRNEDTVSRLMAAFRLDYGRNWKVKSRRYEGIDAMLDGLAARGQRLCILSNKPQDFTWACVQDLLGAWKFALVFGQREGVPKKPDPSGAIEAAQRLGIAPSDWLYLGDTATDMRTAIGAGMYAVGALWGFRNAEELREAGARRLVAHPTEVLELL